MEKVYGHKSKDEEDIENMNKLLDKGLNGEEIGWIESIDILQKTYSLYKKFHDEKGQHYLIDKIPDIEERKKELINRMMDYKS
jgi:hypothetical protein